MNTLFYVIFSKKNKVGVGLLCFALLYSKRTEKYRKKKNKNSNLIIKPFTKKTKRTQKKGEKKTS